MFKRRDKRTTFQSVRQAVWPRGGWKRAAQYIKHRVHRLPDTPEKIARGIFIGLFVSFSPFFGLHFVIAAFLAALLRANVVAAVLGTFVGNPVTFFAIGAVSLNTGYFLLGMRARHGPPIGAQFSHAFGDLWHNFIAIFTDAPAHWDYLIAFCHNVFYPYLIGGLVPGVIVGLSGYFLSLPILRAYQTRRKGILRQKLVGLAKKPADGGPVQ